MPTIRLQLRRLRLATLALSLGLSALGAQAQTPASPPSPPSPPAVLSVPTVDAAVLGRLDDMGRYLRTLKQFVVYAEASTDEVLGTGQKIQFDSKVEYQLGGERLLRASVRSDRHSRDYYFDGKTLTQVAPRLGYYATALMEGSIAQSIAEAAHRYNIEMPLADLFFWGTPMGAQETVKSASLIGPARIAGLECDHLALRQDGVDWQVWVLRGERPLPIKVVITTLDEPSQPQYMAKLHWDLKAKPSERSFRFVPAKGMQRIELKSASAQN